MLKKRSAVGTPSVRTDVFSYDSLDRALAVDNDIEHPVNCSTATIGTPIQDEEYRYDNCNAPDVPTGFACSNALGRMTIARAVLQCGSGGTTVKRGRWYDYDGIGRTAHVAYATVTDSTIGTPAIMDYSYTAAGRVSQYHSPINSIYGTQYTYLPSSGHVDSLKTTESTPSVITNGIAYHPFGPLSWLSLPVNDGYRTLKSFMAVKSDGSPDVLDWRMAAINFPQQQDIGLLNQYLYYSKAGLITERRDYADKPSARYYEYDALLRMKCEARGGLSPLMFASAADCNTSSTRLAGLFTYGNGESASSPPDVRLTAFSRSQDASYVSPSLENSSYSSGSSQVQGIARTGSSLVIGHDAFGRRSYEYDSFDSVRSRRDYTYLPNGQLGSISGSDSVNNTYSVSIRYDEAGHPLTIAEFASGAPRDNYELFWDDADRLIAVNITFGSQRACGARRVGSHGPWLPVYCTNARWHYHYLGNKLIAATRELVKTGLGNPGEPLKRFWAVTDERGLVYRLVDSSSATYWQARWDANGARTWVGTPQAEMWVPFALPGQILLDKNVIYSGLDTSDPEFAVLTTAETWGTRAYASGAGGTWTRPAIALNRWRAYDPLFGAFLQPDGLDQTGRLLPEGYVAARANYVQTFDRDGAKGKYDVPLMDPAMGFDSSCDGRHGEIRRAAMAAMKDIQGCQHGLCEFPAFRKQTIYALSNGKYFCPNETTGDVCSELDGNFTTFGYVAKNDYYNLIYQDVGTECRNIRSGRTAGAKTVIREGNRLPERNIAIADGMFANSCVLRWVMAHEAMHGSMGTFSSLQPQDKAPWEAVGDNHPRINDILENCISCQMPVGFQYAE
jgi:hypothetical protein